MSWSTPDLSLPVIVPQRLSPFSPGLLPVLILVAADAAAIILSGLACRALNAAGHAGGTPREVLVVIGTALLCVLMLQRRGFYAPPCYGAGPGRALALVMTIAHGFALLLLGLLFWEQVQPLWPVGNRPGFSPHLDSILATNRNWLFTWALLAPATVMVLRRPIQAALARAEPKAALRRALVIGDAASATRLAQRLARGTTLGSGLAIVGCFIRAPEAEARAVAAAAGWRSLGGLRAVRAALAHGEADLLLIAVPGQATRSIAAIHRAMAGIAVDILVAPDIAWAEAQPARLACVGGLPFLTLQEKPFSSGAMRIKRAEDVLIGGLLLMVAMPLMALIALAVRLHSPGPALFIQPRQGLNGRIIHVLKFRTMRQEAGDVRGVAQAVANDARVTPLGRLLRRLSLDELPQLINVIGGSMSLVGPRPHALGTVAGGRPFGEAAAAYPARHRVKPGITGWAQVRGLRGETATVDKLRARLAHDLDYIARWSLWFDLRILALTLLSIWRGEGV